MITRLILCLLMLTNISITNPTFGQDAASPVIDQITTVSAASAELVPQTDKVLIVGKDLNLTPTYGIQFIAKAPYAEVYRLVTINNQTYASFPPTTVRPVNDKFTITGNANDKLGIALRTEIPVWFEATIKPSGTPPPEITPDSNWAELTKISDTEADKLNDPKTRANLSKAFKSVIAMSESKTLEELKTLMVNARRMTLQLREGTSLDVNWENWKFALDPKLKVDTKENYINSYKAIIAGLDQ